MVGGLKLFQEDIDRREKLVGRFSTCKKRPRELTCIHMICIGHFHTEIYIFTRWGLMTESSAIHKQRRTDGVKIVNVYQQIYLPGMLTHDQARYGKCGFSLGFRYRAQDTMHSEPLFISKYLLLSIKS